MTLSRVAAGYEADTLARLLDDGYLDLLTEGGTRLASLRFQRPSADPSYDGILRFFPLEAESLAPASGTAARFQAYAADHRTVILDGAVGDDGPLVMNNPVIRAGGRVTLRDATLEVARS